MYYQSVLEGEKPRLIDEWQQGKIIWNSVKYDVDKTQKKVNIF